MSSIAVRRLYSQQLQQARFTQPSEVVAWLGSVQAQDYAGAKWSLGLRLPGSTDADIEQAIADKTILRTWTVRGTLHFVAAADIRWLLTLVAPRIIAGNARRYRELELDEHTLHRSSAELARALRGGRLLDRRALLAILEQKGISTQGQRAAYMLQRASLDGLICQGVMRRNVPTYMALDESVPEARTMARDEAMAELAKRYFTSRNPATLQDFVWWSGLATADARAGLEAVRPQLIKETIDGHTYWLSGTMSAVRARSPRVYLLPGFDEYLLSYRDRSASLEGRYASDISAGNGFISTIAIDGRIAGTWKRTFIKGAVVIASNPFTAFNTAERDAFGVATQRYGQFLDMTVVSPYT